MKQEWKMLMKFNVVIPARFASTRLPGKPLVDINGEPMILHVIDQARKSQAERIIVATDHQLVFDCVKEYHAEVILTSPYHQSGTERLAEVVQKCEFSPEEIIVNVQGDEPLIPPNIIDQVAHNIVKHHCKMTTLSVPIDDIEQIFNPNVVKVVQDKNGYALYFSRAPLPWDREQFKTNEIDLSFYQRHIGIYAYQAQFIQDYINLEKSPLESIELLEQLRVLWHGEKIHIEQAISFPPVGVDTLEDLEIVRNFIKNLTT